MAKFELRCRGCKTVYPPTDLHTCGECLGPLEVVYDKCLAPWELRAEIERGPSSLWRYARLLPVNGPVPDEDVGWTPLVRAERLGALLGLERLYLKNDTVNPSFSFKDRVVALAAHKAKEFGYDTIACASTGNLAGAVAAAAARKGLRAVVFVPSTIEPAKIVAPLAYGATLVEVDGTYDEVNRLVAQVAEERHWAFVNFTLRPYYVEGSKTLLFETAEQLGWRLPDALVVPIASGAMYVNTGKAARELVECGLVEPHGLRIYGAQPAGCAPVADAFTRGADRFTPVRTPATIAHSLAIGSPADGNAALQLARGTGASIVAADDDAIREGILVVARTEGIFVEPAGGTTIAALGQLVRAGALQRNDLVVAYLTGNGFKTPEAVDVSGATRVRIPARLSAFEDALPARERSLVEVG
jgi:threonine synthase